MDEEDGMSLLDVICDPQALNDFLHGCNKVPGPPPSDGEGGASQAAAPAACARISELEDDLVGWPSASTGSGEVTGGNLRRSRPEGVHIRQQTRRKEVHIGQQTQPEEATQYNMPSAGLATNPGGATLPQQPPTLSAPRPLPPSSPRPLPPATSLPLPPSAPQPPTPSTPRPPTPSTPRPLPPTAPRPLPPAAPQPLPPSAPRPLPPSAPRPLPPAIPRPPSPAAPRLVPSATPRPPTLAAPRPPSPTAPRPLIPSAPRPLPPSPPQPLPPSTPRPAAPSTPRPLPPATPQPFPPATPRPLPPATPQPLSPSTPQPPTPSTPRPPTPTPSTPRPATPGTPRPPTPSTPRPATPGTPRPPTPSTPQPRTPRPPTPSTPRPAIPSTPRPLLPATPQPLTPSTPRPAIPSTPRPAIPSTPRPAIPSTPRPAIPSTPRPPTPSTPRPATPSTPRPATPATIRPLTPSTLRPPTTTRPPATPPPLIPATPSPLTPSPPLPQPANPHSTNKSSSGHCLVRQVGLNQEQLMASDQTTSNGSPAISSLRQAGPPFAMSIGPIHQQLLAKTGRSSGSCGPASPLGNQVTPSSLVCVLPKGSSLPGNSLFANASLSPPTQPVTLKPATSRQVVHPPPSSMNVEVHRASPAIQPKHCLNIQTKALQRSPKPSLRPNSLALHTMEAAMQQQTAVLNPTFPVDAPVRNVVLPPWASSPMTGQTQPAQPRLHNPTSVHVMTQASTLSVPQPVVPAKRRFILPGHLASVVSGHQPLPAACAGAGLTLGLPRQPAATHIVDHRDPSGQLNANKPSTAQTLTGQSTAWHRTSFGQVSATPGRQPVVGGGRAGVLSGHGQLASSALLRVPTHPDADFPRSRSSEHCVRSVVQPVLLPNRITVPGDTGPTEQPVTLQQLSAISSGSFDVQPRASRNAKLTPGLGLLHARAPPPYCPHAPAQLQGSWHPPPLSVTPPQTGNTLGENTGQCISQLEGRDTLICDQLLMFQQKEQKQQLLYRQVLKMQQERGLCLTSSSRPPVSSAAVPVITSGGSGAAVQAKTNLVPANAVPMEPENYTVTPRPQSSLFLPVLASQFEEPAGSLKQSVETIQNRDNLLLERFCKDQTSVMQPDCNAPFHSFEDTVLSLLPYHVCEGTMPSSVDFNKVDEEFQVASTNLLKQTQAMQNKYHMLLLEESRRTKSSAEMVMINRMFIQEEKVAFLEARQLARDSPDAYISSVFQPDIDNSPPSSARLLDAPNTLPSTKQLAAPELVIRQARSWSLDIGARALPAGEDPVVSSPPSPPKIYTVRSKSGLKLKIKQEAGYNQVVHNTEFDHPPVGPVKQLSGTRGCTPSPFNHSKRVCNCTTPSLAERRLLERLGTRDLSKQRLHLAKGKLNHPCCCSPVLVPDPTRTYLPLDSAANRLGDDQKVSHSCCPLGTGARQLTSDSRNASSSLPFRTRGRPGGRWGNHTSNEVEDTIARGLMEVDSICHLPWELSLPRPKRRRSESEENGSFSSDSPQDNALNQHLQSAINSILDLQRLQTSEEEPPELAELSTPPCSPSPSSGDFMQQEHESGVLGAETSTLGEVVNSI